MVFMKSILLLIFSFLLFSSLFATEAIEYIKMLSSLEEAEQIALTNNNQVKQLTSLVNQAKQEQAVTDDVDNGQALL